VNKASRCFFAGTVIPYLSAEAEDLAIPQISIIIERGTSASRAMFSQRKGEASAGNSRAIVGKKWACNRGQSRHTRDTAGQPKTQCWIGLTTKSAGAGDGNRTRVLSLGSGERKLRAP
jgi:hypothetical protein